MTEIEFFDDPENEPEEQEPLNEDELNVRLHKIYSEATPEERGEVQHGAV